MLKPIVPALEQLNFKQELLSDNETMSYNKAYGGCIDFPKENWLDWYNRWINKSNKYYAYLYSDDENCFVGEIAYHINEDEKCILNIIIHSKFRGKGYGKIGLNILCSIAKQNNIDTVYDDVAIDNPSINLFLKCGFIEEYKTSEYIMFMKNL